jgi:hypothetical protein
VSNEVVPVMPTIGGRQEPHSEENQGVAWHLKTAMKEAAEE